MTSHAIRILGIDPGLRRTGWGVIDVDGNRLIYVGCGSVESREAQPLAERLRETVASEPVRVAEVEVTVTISMGVAAWEPNEYGDIQALLRAADVALYEAKRAGRNLVRTAWEHSPPLARAARVA